MKLYINANRTGYAPDQIRHTMTVGELIDALREFDEDAQVYLRHDGGYTYGGITWMDFEEDYRSCKTRLASGLVIHRIFHIIRLNEVRRAKICAHLIRNQLPIISGNLRLIVCHAKPPVDSTFPSEQILSG